MVGGHGLLARKLRSDCDADALALLSQPIYTLQHWRSIPHEQADSGEGCCLVWQLVIPSEYLGPLTGGGRLVVNVTPIHAGGVAELNPTKRRREQSTF
jgi:hypothetical protein